LGDGSLIIRLIGVLETDQSKNGAQALAHSGTYDHGQPSRHSDRPASDSRELPALPYRTPDSRRSLLLHLPESLYFPVRP
jgi:hypothetical protein